MNRATMIPRRPVASRSVRPLRLPCMFLLLACAAGCCCDAKDRGSVRTIVASWHFNDRLEASPAGCDARIVYEGSTGYRGGGLSTDDLEPSPGIEVLRADTVIEGMDIAGGVEVKAPRAIVRNSRIRSMARYPVRVFPGASLIIEYTEIIGGPAAEAAVSPADYTARRLDVHGTRDGLRAGSNVIIESCYVHDLAAGDDYLNAGIRQRSGRNVLIRNNTIQMPPGSSSAIMIATDAGPIDNVLIDGNTVNGGGFTIHSGTGRHLPRVAPTNVRINNNRMGRSFGLGLFCTGRKTTFSGNVWFDSGQAVPLPF